MIIILLWIFNTISSDVPKPPPTLPQREGFGSHRFPSRREFTLPISDATRQPPPSHIIDEPMPSQSASVPSQSWIASLDNIAENFSQLYHETTPRRGALRSLSPTPPEQPHTSSEKLDFGIRRYRKPEPLESIVELDIDTNSTPSRSERSSISEISSFSSGKQSPLLVRPGSLRRKSDLPPYFFTPSDRPKRTDSDNSSPLNTQWNSAVEAYHRKYSGI